MKAQGDMSCQEKKKYNEQVVWRTQLLPPPAMKKGGRKKKLFEFFRKRECTPVRYNLKALKWTQQNIKKKEYLLFFLKAQPEEVRNEKRVGNKTT